MKKKISSLLFLIFITFSNVVHSNASDLLYDEPSKYGDIGTTYIDTVGQIALPIFLLSGFSVLVIISVFITFLLSKSSTKKSKIALFIALVTALIITICSGAIFNSHTKVFI